MNKLTGKLLRRFNTTNPFVIAQGLNIHIRYANFEDGTRGLYYRVLRRRFIVIHDQLDENWQRFVCAHELGHDRLHPGLSRFWLDEHSLSNPGKFEREANHFAVELLMPNDLLFEGMTLYEAAAICGVPPEVAHLKIKPESKKRYMHV